MWPDLINRLVTSSSRVKLLPRANFIVYIFVVLVALGAVARVSHVIYVCQGI